MNADLFLLLVSIVTGAALQVGVGIGFSIIVAPVMMVSMGTATAVPLLLALNTLVSLVAVDWRMWLQERRLITDALGGCLVGIFLGLLVYPYLSERVVLLLTATFLLIGVLTTLLPVKASLNRTGFRATSGLSGLATVWAATPGPLMVIGFLAVGRSAKEARRLVQPVALIAYGIAFALHSYLDWTVITRNTRLGEFLAAAFVGSLVGRWVGPLLPHKAIANAIRIISVGACIILYGRALALGA